MGMEWVAAIIGFIGGFMVGQWILMHLLQGIPTNELINNKKLRLKYGIINWLVAIIGGVCSMKLYEYTMMGAY
jgi:hypothetical protein